MPRAAQTSTNKYTITNSIFDIFNLNGNWKPIGTRQSGYTASITDMLRMLKKIIENYVLCLAARQYISVRGYGPNNGKYYWLTNILGDASDSNLGIRLWL